MNTIKVIFTGGTIGSLAKGNDISPDKETQYLLLEKYKEKTGNDTKRFKVSSPMNILSENARLENVLQMAREIEKAQKEDVRGIILTHGTDTLSYSSAYLSFLVQKCKVPVVMVGSNYVITDKKANGVDNFASAVSFIDNPRTQPGIYVSYKNPGEEFTSIHLGSRMCEPPAHSDCYYSPVGFRYAKVKDGRVTFENICSYKTYKKFKYAGSINKKGLYIHPYTGLDYNVYKDVDCDFILHNLYHSGTANTQTVVNKKQETNLLNFAEHCKAKKIPLYLCNIEKKDVNYNSTNQMLCSDIKFLYNILPNVALAKLYIAYNFLDKEKREEFLNTNVAGEMLEYPLEYVEIKTNENIEEIKEEQKF